MAIATSRFVRITRAYSLCVKHLYLPQKRAQRYCFFLICANYLRFFFISDAFFLFKWNKFCTFAGKMGGMVMVQVSGFPDFVGINKFQVLCFKIHVSSAER